MWISELTRIPSTANSFLRANYHRKREEFARKWLVKVINLLNPMLVASMAFFALGFLYQSWTTPTGGPRSRLLTASSAVSTTLTGLITFIVILTTIHAIRHPESPFSSPLSELFRRLLAPESLTEYMVNNTRMYLAYGPYGQISREDSNYYHSKGRDTLDPNYWDLTAPILSQLYPFCN